MSRLAACLLAAAFLAALPASAPPVLAADLITVQPVTGLCSETRYLGWIRNKFRYQVQHVPELPRVAIRDFLNIREVRYEPEDETHPIFRQYCEADVVLTGGEGSRSIWYLIEGDQGFASIGNNVEFCVAGFDRWNVYNGRCRVLR